MKYLPLLLILLAGCSRLPWKYVEPMNCIERASYWENSSVHVSECVKFVPIENKGEIPTNGLIKHRSKF